MVRIVDLQEVTASSMDSSDYFVISHLNPSVGTYGTARISAGHFYQFLNGPPPGYSLNNTDELPEGSTNLYYTNARARGSISVSGSLSYNTSSGLISYTQPTNITSFVNNAGYLDSLGTSLLIDSAYINARVVIPQAYGDDDVRLLVDSAYIQSKQITYDFLDSSEVISLIDSDYVNARVSTVDSSQVIAITDPLYVSLSGDSMVGDFWVDGAIYASGNITGFGSFSDITVKENIAKIENALDKVSQLSGYTFNYIGDDRRIAGLIAQEVELVHPEVVYYTPDNKKAIHYGNMMGLIVESLKELRSDLDQIKEKIK